MDFKDLAVYKKAFDLSMKIYEISKTFPKEETYALTDQIRRSSRSVCANIAEAYRKRIYPAHFVSKASDADMENAETQVWINFALACNYISENQFKKHMESSSEIGKPINHIIKNPEKYI